jgi:hypothetical protein
MARLSIRRLPAPVPARGAHHQQSDGRQPWDDDARGMVELFPLPTSSRPVPGGVDVPARSRVPGSH